MTEEEAIQIIHRRYERNTDYPVDGDEDYSLYRGYLSDSIEKWGNLAKEENVKFRELYTSLADSSDGDKTTTAGEKTLDAPTDFVEISSFVTITDSNGASSVYHYVRPDRMMEIEKNNSTANNFTVTGVLGAKKLVFIKAFAETGSTVSYRYYKTPTVTTTTTDVIEMSKPYFAIYDVLSTLNEEDRPDLAQIYATKASSVFESMVIENEVSPEGEIDMPEDLDYERYGSALGV